jgi:hypothetical protein
VVAREFVRAVPYAGHQVLLKLGRRTSTRGRYALVVRQGPRTVARRAVDFG